ncbi:hypothetical protein [Qipengyuania sp. JC766]|uniref:hypothetical protein n=1 Tax=Qipengyuania sp. JC766 TaxID=3232139 RepID=UPI003458C4DC
MKNAQKTVEIGRELAQNAIDRIPDDAWPVLDLAFQILLVVAAVWLFLSLIAWWRRRAYNLTVASTARRNRKAQPEFLKVDEKARREAIARGHEHAERLDDRDREEELAALRAGKEPVTLAKRIASLASLILSVFTLFTTVSGVFMQVTKVGNEATEWTVGDRLQYVIENHPIATTVAVVIILIHVFQYFYDRKWQKD